MIPLNRFGEAEEVAICFVFGNPERHRIFTGEVININGRNLFLNKQRKDEQGGYYRLWEYYSCLGKNLDEAQKISLANGPSGIGVLMKKKNGILISFLF